MWFNPSLNKSQVFFSCRVNSSWVLSWGASSPKSCSLTCNIWSSCTEKCQNTWKLSKRNVSNTLNSDFHSNRNAESPLMALTHQRHTTTEQGNWNPPYIVAQRTDCSQLWETITGAPNNFWWPLTWILINLCSYQDLEDLISVHYHSIV